MASALTAWLSAPAPTTCTSTMPDSRTTPAMAPATEFGFDRLDTFRTSWSAPDDAMVTLWVFDRRAAPSCHPRANSDNPEPGWLVERDRLVVGIERRNL